MDSTTNREQKAAMAKKASSPSRVTPSRSSAPTKFILKSEKEMEQSIDQRGRRSSRDSTTAPVLQDTQTTPTSSLMGGSSFGVQSLEETICSAFPSDESILCRTASNSSTKSFTGLEQLGNTGDEVGLSIGQKRKAGNRVHPTIRSTGQRIISSDRTTHASASPISASGSPFRQPLFRRGSNTSSANVESRPLTPLRLSPHPESGLPSTPRSGSPKSFRLSDEESVDGTNSQAITSSHGETDDDQLELPPQLVMPSLAVPSRRPFTERGRRMGKFRVMVLGSEGSGKTSFLNSLHRCEDIVHVDGLSSSLVHSSTNTASSHHARTAGFVEMKASTRPYPSWWIDSETRRSSRHRRSVGEGVLERNLTFVDSPGLDDDEQVDKVMDYVKSTLRRTSDLESMDSNELVGLLSGDGGVQLDAVLHFFDPKLSGSPDPDHINLSPAHQELLRYISKLTTLIPVITRSDTVEPDLLDARRAQISHMLKTIGAEPDRMFEASSAFAKPLAVSFAPSTDIEIDASLLMSSQYLVPFVASELDTLMQNLLDPDNIARMRHLSATKFLMWTKENRGYQVDLPRKRSLESPYLRSTSPGEISNSSHLNDPGKVLVPHSSSSYYRSASPATSDISGKLALAHLTEQAHPSEPFRQIRLAKWAQDLQRSLANERRKYTRMYNIGRSSDSDAESDDKALALARPGRGRLGGDLGVIDPRDPLGVLAFGRRGFFILEVLGGCGLVGVVAYWATKNWSDVLEFLGLQTTSPPLVHAVAVSPPTSGTKIPLLGWIDEQYWRGFFGWR